MKRKLEFPCFIQKSSRNSGRTQKLFKAFSNQELWNFRNAIRCQGKNHSGRDRELHLWFALPDLASLLPASISHDLELAQQRQSTRQMDPTQAKPVPATPQAGKEPAFKRRVSGCPRWSLQLEAPGCPPAMESGISTPQTKRYDVYTLCISAKGFRVNHR